jgi:HK97 family phage portal protein
MLTVSGGSIPLAPQSLAELVPIIPEAYYYPVSRLPINVWDIKNDTRELDTRSAYARLVADPCPYMDPFSFWGWVQRTLDIYGETYLAINKDDNGAPINLMPMHPSRVAIKRNPDTGRYTYYFQAGSGIGTEVVSFDEGSVVPFKLFNPNKLERGMSKMEALKSTIFAEDSSRNATSSMWKNAGRPNLVLETPNRLGEAGRKRLKLAFDQAHAGSTNAGQTLVLEDGVTAKPIQVTAVDMQYIQARQLNREEVCGVYDVAPPIVHILERATFSNISEQMRGFYRDTMAPVIEFIQSVMDKFVGSYWLRPNIMRFDVDGVIRGDYEHRMDAAQKGIATGVLTPNEARDMVGLNRYSDPKADRLFANSAIQFLGEPSEQLRMTEPAVGVTPDGIHLAPPVPVATPNGTKPNTVPNALPRAPVANTGGNAAGPQPNNSTPSSRPASHPANPRKYLRQIKGAVGRGKSLEEIQTLAMDLAAEATNPEDLEDILQAVKDAYADKDT